MTIKRAIMIKSRLKDLIASKGLESQAAFSEDIGWRPATVSEWVNNQRTTYNKEQICELLTYFQCELHDLLEVIWIAEEQNE